jgi:UDP-N-acetylenolpyruvoylglucosamine reductase
MNVKARWFVEYESTKELSELLNLPLVRDNKLLHIGGGSNLLFTHDYDGVVLHSCIRFIRKIKENDEYVWVEAGSGVVWDNFCRYAVENGWGGAENLSYIPGEVGASAIQNIGAYGAEAAEIIDQVITVEISTGCQRVFDVEACQYGYRKSIFKEELKGKYIVTSVIYRLSRNPELKLDYGNLRGALVGTDPITLADVRRAVVEIRRAKLPDPEVMGNAGSFFMNPVINRVQYDHLLKEYPQMPHYRIDDEHVKIPAAWMIEQCGWKGRTWGGAGVHDKQCLVLINKNQATAADVQNLASAICDSVNEKFGIRIFPEVNYIE